MPQLTEPSQWRARIERCKSRRRDLMQEWTANVEYLEGAKRRTRYYSTDQDNYVDVNIDWQITQTKIAQLFSQQPHVVLQPKHPAFNSAVPVFQKKLNDTLHNAKVSNAVREVLYDCVNAAGIGAVLVSYEATTETVEVPEIDPSTLLPEQQAQLALGVFEVPMIPVDRVVDSLFRVDRISPADLLWPIEFTGSDFDSAPWIGRSGTIPVALGAASFGLDEDQLAMASKTTPNREDSGYGTLSNEEEEYRDAATDHISFDEVYYKRIVYDSEEKYFDAIHRVVFVDGISEPVIDEPWQGQQVIQGSGSFKGSTKYPIRVLTLAYISDEPIPPSDSAIIRPQVNELNKARTQMIRQRDHSIPIRWFDVNRVDSAVQDSLMRGTWGGMIPVIGNGTNAIGEVARAVYPREDFEFYRVAKQDIQEAMGLGPNQLGQISSGRTSAAEVTSASSGSQTRITYQRRLTETFFVGIAEVMAGLLTLYGDFGATEIAQDEAARLQGWDTNAISNNVVFSVLADSTMVLDHQQRLARLVQFINHAAQSGFMQAEPVLRELASLSGLDPDEAIKAPEPAGPEPPNISFRFSGAEDLVNPVIVAMLMKAGQAPTPDELQAAQTLLTRAGVIPQQGPGALPKPVAKPEAEPREESRPSFSFGAPLPSQGGLPPVGPFQNPRGPIQGNTPTQAVPPNNWNLNSRLNRRS